MSPGPFALRIQHGIVGGFVPPNPSAIHSLTLEDPPGSISSPILLLSQFPSNPMAELIPKNIAISDETTTLIKELEGILRKLPFEEVPSADIYERNIGIFWQGPDGFLWANSAPEGCSQSGGTTVTVTKENKDAFNRAVEITEILVEKGAAQEGI